MRLEDATKEELVWWIRRHEFAFRRELCGFGTEILTHRMDQHQSKANEAFGRYMAAVVARMELLAPYTRTTLDEMPRKVYQRCVALEGEIKRARKQWQAHNAASKRCYEALTGGGHGG